MLLPEKKIRLFYQISFSFLSGILLILSFPKFGRGFIAWVALVPLIYSLKDIKSLSTAFSLGFITGLTCHIGILYWITYVVVRYGNLPYYAGISAMLLLAVYLSLYTAMFGAGVYYFREKSVPNIFTIPVLWTVLEYAKSHLLTGFPWENLAYSQYGYLPFIQIADITGIYGITFIIIMINVTICDVIIMTESTRKRVAGEIILGFLIVFIVCIYGISKIDQMESLKRNAKHIDISVIQGNIEQDIKWNRQFQQESIDIYRKHSLSTTVSGSKLIVWPETATPFYFQDPDIMHEFVINIAKDSGRWLLFGSPSYFKDEHGLSFMNSAFLLSPDGNICGKYDKVHLVPYGEYVPLRTVFPFINKIVVGVGDFTVGKGFYPLQMDQHKLGVLICYEGIFPEIARSYKNSGADLLINITNDAWYGRTSAPYQHLSMTIFRAVETRTYVVRAANTGITAFIDPTGNIIRRTGLFEETSLNETVNFMNEKTFYILYGDIFIYVCILSILIFIIIPKRRNKNV